jgi:hypothetical protein
MVDFCPKCGAMLPAGTERCASCGARVQPRIMDRRSGFTWGDFAGYSIVGILFAIAALLIPLTICAALYGIYLLLATLALAG